MNFTRVGFRHFLVLGLALGLVLSDGGEKAEAAMALPTVSPSGANEIDCSVSTTSGNGISCTLTPGSGQTLYITGFAITESSCPNCSGSVTVASNTNPTPAQTLASYQFTVGDYFGGDLAGNSLVVNFPVPLTFGTPGQTLFINVPALGANNIIVTGTGLSY